MKSPFKNIGIVTRPNTPEIQDTVHTLVSFLRENGFTIYLDELSVEEHCVYIQDSAYCETVNKAQLGKYCDLVIVLGGDGTFLSAAREVARALSPSSASIKATWAFSPKSHATPWLRASAPYWKANICPKNASSSKPASFVTAKPSNAPSPSTTLYFLVAAQAK